MVAGLVVVAVLSGWGTPLVAPHSMGDPAAGRAVRALTGDRAEQALAALPPDFAEAAGYRPMIIDRAGQRVAARGAGGCSSPLGASPFDFSAICARHDLGYDLLRYAVHRGDPLGEWARHAIDDQFVRGLAARCRAQPEAGFTCAVTAALYVAVVWLNSWRQGDGAPLAESGGRWAVALTAGICVGLGIARSRRSTQRAGWHIGSGGPTMGLLRIRTLDPTGAAVAVLAAALSLGPSLLPLGPVVQGAVVGIVAVHGYAAVMLVRALRRRWLSAVTPVRGARRAARVLRGRWLAMFVVFGVASGGLVAPGASAAPAFRTLGQEGLRFVTGGPHAAEIAAVAGGPALDPLRIYVGMSSAGSVADRVGLAVAELERAGGFTRSAVLVVVPTGSGWVNPAAVRALEHLTRGDLATVVVQYAAQPSWREFLRGGASAERSATALVDALRFRLAAAGTKLLVYGESMGALGALPVVAAADGALLAGLPGAAWEPAPGPPARAVLHRDDPVGWWSPQLLVQRPDGWSGPWFPVVTFWQVTGSLLGALEAPPGHGHRYGGELVDAWRSAGVGTALPSERLAAVRAAVDPAFDTREDHAPSITSGRVDSRLSSPSD